jgi:hypothetical protein
MKRFIVFLISSCAVLFAYAQEEINLDSIPKIQRSTDVRDLNMEKPLIFDDSFSLEEFNQFDKAIFSQPLLPDFTKNMNFKKDLSYSGISGESFLPVRFGISPFFTSGIIFNQATYRLNDRFSFGGSSFGAQSVFDKPKMNSSIRDMSTKGASMFMQYKFSNNFKVETRVSITNRQSPLEP